MQVYNAKGDPLDATIQLEVQADGPRIVFESRSPTRNKDYIRGFDTVLTRLAELTAILRDAMVVSKQTESLTPDQRRLYLAHKHYPFQLTSAEEAIATARSLRRAAAAVARPTNARGGGNPTKRVEIRFEIPRRKRATLAWLIQQIARPHDSSLIQGGENWSEEEVRLVVADYADKPLSNAQGLLRETVRGHLEGNPTALKELINILDAVPDSVVADYNAVLVPPPSSATARSLARRRGAHKFDFASRDAKNRSLGAQGELWVIECERARLKAAGCVHLVQAIEHVSQTQGDGAGYDIHSKNLDGSDRFIEVKTTNGNRLTPFLLTANELECSRELGSAYHLYRVFEFSSNPHLFVITGSLDQTLQLEPTEYRVRFKPSD